MEVSQIKENREGWGGPPPCIQCNWNVAHLAHLIVHGVPSDDRRPAKQLLRCCKSMKATMRGRFRISSVCVTCRDAKYYATLPRARVSQYLNMEWIGICRVCVTDTIKL